MVKYCRPVVVRMCQRTARWCCIGLTAVPIAVRTRALRRTSKVAPIRKPFTSKLKVKFTLARYPLFHFFSVFFFNGSFYFFYGYLVRLNWNNSVPQARSLFNNNGDPLYRGFSRFPRGRPQSRPSSNRDEVFS